MLARGLGLGLELACFMDNLIIKQKLSMLSSGLELLSKNWGTDPVISGLAYDSRRVKQGNIFVALRGEHTDGHRFLEQAFKQGAVAFVVEDRQALASLALPYVVVPDCRQALSSLAARLYGFPSQDLYVIGVTGTDGKSTTVYFIYQLLTALGFKAGFISTVSLQAEAGLEDNPFRQSTPEAPEIQEFLARLKTCGKEIAVVEATSHGLSSKTCRLKDVIFDAGVFTNLGHEHLEFHGTYEDYRESKARLFKSLAQRTGKKKSFLRIAFINLDDPQAEFFSQACGSIPVWTYALKNTWARLRAFDLKVLPEGTSFKVTDRLVIEDVFLPVAGLFNVENFLASLISVAGITGISWQEIAKLARRLKLPKGRMESVVCGQPFRVLVDFAHTPQAFGKLLPIMKKETAGRLIVVFGSAGERDLGKRQMQGELACRYADLVILTDEDPRGEPSLKILNEIAQGCKDKKEGENLFLIPDRHKAIQKAFLLAKEQDTVLLLGKGHEKSIIYQNYVRPWDEKEVAQEILAGMGFALFNIRDEGGKATGKGKL